MFRGAGSLSIILGVIVVTLRAGDADRQHGRADLLLRLAAIDESIRQDRDLLTEAESELLVRRGAYEQASAFAREAESTESDALRRAKAAQRHEAAVFRRLKDGLKTDPDAVAAQEELAAAQRALAQERERVLEPVRETPEHRRAAESLEHVRTELDRARAAGAAASDLSPLIDRATEQSNALAAIEKRAMEADERYLDALARVRESRAALGEVNRKSADRIRIDEDRLAAVEAVEKTAELAAAAETEADRARRALASAKRSYAQAAGAVDTIRQRIEASQRLRLRYQWELGILGAAR